MEAQSFDLARLERQVNLDEQAYLSYVRTTEESRLSNALEQSEILRLSIIEPATIPDGAGQSQEEADPELSPSWEAWSSALLSGFAFEFLDTTIKTAEDIRRYANLDVLAVLPERAS